MFEERQKQLIDRFTARPNREARYNLIMELGRELPKMDTKFKLEENLVPGCQSQMYLHASFDGNTLHFQADADALISKGIAALLLYIYNDLPPMQILKPPLEFFDKIQIFSSLSPNRSNGLQSLLTRMQQHAIRLI
ncbi:MAG: SufE family protein [Simkaniaceae bacterium]|nr:SufE family protein [Simkaniaceae bacterium]